MGTSHTECEVYIIFVSITFKFQTAPNSTLLSMQETIFECFKIDRQKNEHSSVSGSLV